MYINKGAEMKKKGIIGIVIIAVAIFSMFGWEVYGRKMITYDNIVVLKNNIEKSEIITKNMLTTRRIDGKVIGALTEKDIDKIIGMQAKQFIHKQVQLFPSYFSEKGLVPNENQYVFAIPNDWIKSFPQSLRRGDTAYFYKVSDIGDSAPKLLTHAEVAFAKDNTNNEVTSKDVGRLSGSAIVSVIEVVVDKHQAALLASSISNSEKLVIMYK